jgi:hypothetical protein
VSPTQQPDDAIIAWHWHPESRLECHTHVYATHPAVGELGRLHLPSRRVSVEELFRMLISDGQVVPAREDWKDVLDDGQHRFEEAQQWR